MEKMSYKCLVYESVDDKSLSFSLYLKIWRKKESGNKWVN